MFSPPDVMYEHTDAQLPLPPQEGAQTWFAPSLLPTPFLPAAKAYKALLEHWRLLNLARLSLVSKD